MKLRDYLQQDTLEAAWFAADNPIAAGAKGITPVLTAFKAHAGALAPDECTVGRKTVPYAPDAVVRLVASARADSKTVVNLTRRTDPEVDYELSFVGPGWTVASWLRMYLPLAAVLRGEAASARAEAVVALLRGLAGAGRTLQGYAHPRSDLQLGENPFAASASAEPGVHEAHWLDLLGTELVDRIGRERVLATPAYRVESLPGGHVLMLTQPTPANVASEEARVAQARVLAHLRDDLSFDAALARLRLRSAALAPADATRWDSDIADLLARVADSVPLGERPQATDRLAAYRPPEVSEWRPLADLLPADVDDPVSTTGTYGDLWAEQFAALLHRDVRAAFDAGPDALPLVDHHFWHTDVPAAFPREDIERRLVPAAGAYLGELLVAHLGGRWVPRRALDESQVVVGDRAWLPFLRARRWLHDRQSVLDHSLTQFYRVAAHGG